MFEEPSDAVDRQLLTGSALSPERFAAVAAAVQENRLKIARLRSLDLGMCIRRWCFAPLSADRRHDLHRPATRLITELGESIRTGVLSPVSLLEDCLDRIAANDNDVLAFVHESEGARASAQSAEGDIRAGHRKGPLHGIPIAVKDNYPTVDMPTQVGTRAHVPPCPNVDAHLEAKLRCAGAVIIGKTQTHEFA